MCAGAVLWPPRQHPSLGRAAARGAATRARPCNARVFTGVKVRGGGNDGGVIPLPVDGQLAQNHEEMAVTTMRPDRRGVAVEGLDVRRAGEFLRKFSHGDVRPATQH